MLSALLKKQLQEIFRSYFYNAKQGKARSRASTLGYFAFFAVLMVGVLGGMFTYLAIPCARRSLQPGWNGCISRSWPWSPSCSVHSARIQHLFEPLSCQG